MENYFIGGGITFLVIYVFGLFTGWVIWEASK